jgi:hypothetical protein
MSGTIIKYKVTVEVTVSTDDRGYDKYDTIYTNVVSGLNMQDLVAVVNKIPTGNYKPTIQKLPRKRPPEYPIDMGV